MSDSQLQPSEQLPSQSSTSQSTTSQSTPSPPPSLVRQNYDSSCEDEVNKHINLELHTSYIYLSMGYNFQRDDMALKHFSRFFLRLSRNARERAEKMMQLQVLRGGRIKLSDINIPDQLEWDSGLNALNYALNREQHVNDQLISIHQLAIDLYDAHLRDFLERFFLHEQVKLIKELGDHIINLRNMGVEEQIFAEYLFDRLTLGSGDSNN
ncbi:ferritin heavy chain-like [Erinaceus europaeus]|uniref:Ferritin n=1 Tax=Erinaceus europaeus TaxID=9365 RepID=A0A1S2ZG69_ERIEU|nr:ferritin heavy chain-like [Erinaceus europaeus]